MSDEVARHTEAEAEWVAVQSRWTRSWRQAVMLAIPLVYLVFVVVSVEQNSRGAAAVAGYVLLAVFAGCWIVTPFVLTEETSRLRFWGWYAFLVALTAAEIPFARAAGFVLCVFLTMLTVARLGARAAPFVAVMALAALLIPIAVGSWHVSLAKSFADVTPVAIPVVALAMAGVMQVVRANQALAETRAELARLAAENERIRIARDLHDLLGHSLTTITVKAGLARRLGPTDPGGAVDQITEVEELCRKALTEVRAVCPDAGGELAELLGHPGVVLGELDAAAAAQVEQLLTEAGVFDALAGHIAHVARSRGWPVLTADAGRLRRIAPDLEFDLL